MKQNIKLAIVGRRNFKQPKVLYKIVDQLVKEQDYNVIEIVSGGASGVDSYGASYGQYHQIPVKIFPAEWEKYGKSAGYKRNVLIINECDVCIAFWDGDERGGTYHDIKLCRESNKPCWIYNYLTQELYLD